MMKNRDTHIKEIQAFQWYFETVYNPCNLSRTIYDTIVTLKHKVKEKLPNFKIPPYVEDRYNFALKFYFSKLPPLRTYEFWLTFRPPIPDWFFCGSLSTLNNELKKPRHRVVSTKYHLDNYICHLHVDVEHVQVLSPISTGEMQDS